MLPLIIFFYPWHCQLREFLGEWWDRTHRAFRAIMESDIGVRTRYKRYVLVSGVPHVDDDKHIFDQLCRVSVKETKEERGDIPSEEHP